MDYTTWMLPGDGGMTSETVAVASLYEVLQKLSDKRRAQGKRYS